MSTLGHESKVGVVGAGAMGSGIAQVAATYGHTVTLYDKSSDALKRALASVERNLARSVEKSGLKMDDAQAILSRIITVAGGTDRGMLDVFRGSGLVIEAVVEDLAVKRELFTRLESVIGNDAILGTNTSSLSVTAIARDCKRPERVIGIHFFNPATILPLVEIVPGLATREDVTVATQSLVDAWGKTTVRATDTPGFIVNRIARPYYGEALRIYEEGIADMATIDWAMREFGGFKMGPFELMDFIGNDINFAATRSVFKGTYFDPRYKPFVTQQRLVEAGFLGRKSGRGYYDYSPGAKQPQPIKNHVLGEKIFDRILAMLINEAADAVLFRNATAKDIDLAMTKGVNYPKGLLEWADEIGVAKVLSRLDFLHREYGEDRYRPSALLRRMAAQRTTFFQPARSTNFSE